jgi:hypothetical protein
MLRTTLFSLLLFSAFSISAQSWEPEYFPAELMESDGVRMVTEYETQIDDPLDQAGQGNRIRLARTMNYDLDFDTLGRKTRLLNYKEGNKPQDFLTFEYDSLGRLIKSSYTYPQSASALPEEVNPGTVIPHRRHTLHVFNENGKQDYRLVKTENGEGIRLTDSIQFNYDVLGRLDKQVQYIWRDTLPDSLMRIYTHFARGLNITTRVGDQILSRELLKFDGTNRLISREFFEGRNQVPRSRELYSYNPRGWLEKVEYAYDWDFFKQAESVISRENIYDDHGKLSEATLDFGDGRRVVQYYDYSYHVSADPK